MKAFRNTCENRVYSIRIAGELLRAASLPAPPCESSFSTSSSSDSPSCNTQHAVDRCKATYCNRSCAVAAVALDTKGADKTREDQTAPHVLIVQGIWPEFPAADFCDTRRPWQKSVIRPVTHVVHVAMWVTVGKQGQSSGPVE